MVRNKKIKYLKSNSAKIQDVFWNERGPNNIGGRTRALEWDPNDISGKKVWAGSVVGACGTTTTLPILRVTGKV